MKILLATAALGAALALTTFSAQAENRLECRAKIERAQYRYDRAAERYGVHSDNAFREHLKVDEIRQKCWAQFHMRWDDHGHETHADHW